MKTKRILALILALAMVFALTACGSSPKEETPAQPGEAPADNAEPAAESYTIRIANSSPASEFEGEGSTSLGIGAKYFAREIEARTDGRIKVQLLVGGTAASSTEEYIGGLKTGAFDMIILNSGSWAEFTNAYAGLNIPYLFGSFQQAWDVLDSEIGDSWGAKVYEDTGCTVLGYLDIGFRQLTANVEAHSPADLAGVKIRTMTDPIQIACWEAMGCSVTPVPYAELYTALQQKLVDAQENPPSNIFSAKLYELQDYCILTNHCYTATIPAAGPVFWDKISDEDKALIQEIWTEAVEYSRTFTEQIAEDFLGNISEGGCEIITLTEDELAQFQEAAMTVWPMIEESMGAEAYGALMDYMGVA